MITKTQSALPETIQGRDQYIYVPQKNIFIKEYQSLNGLTKNQAFTEADKNGLIVASPAIFIYHLLNVREAAEKEATIYDGLGTPISTSRAQDLFKHHISNLWIHLDAEFQKGTGIKGLDLVTNSKIVQLEKGKREQRDILPLEECLMKDCFVNLTRDSFNSQGLPVKKADSQIYKRGKNIYYWYPREGSVARFNANSDRANLNCYVDHSSSNSALGVLLCAEGTEKNLNPD